MSTARHSTRNDVAFKPAGVGHHSGWRCDFCLTQRAMAGRKLVRRGVLKLYRCAICEAGRVGA